MGARRPADDVDFYRREADAERGLEALDDAGMGSERPPEGWLVKARDDETLVDLIFRPSGGPIGDEHFQRAELLEVMAQPMLVASLDDVLATKLLSLREQELGYAPVLELSRSVREQVDWDFVRAQASRVPVRARVLHARRATGDRRGGLVRYAAFRSAACCKR
jgi:hypothetical protein